eukprot:scaffold45801_cov57-Phaeocystis_antarctica.AAC.3
MYTPLYPCPVRQAERRSAARGVWAVVAPLALAIAAAALRRPIPRASVWRAASRTPARAVASRGKGRGARPRATDQQLVGVGQGVCALPSRKEGMWCGARCGPGGPEAAGDRGARSVQGKARLQIRRRAREGAHEEHVGHARDAGGVEAQRLVERKRALPRVERRAYGAGRGAAREAGGGGRPRCTQRAGEG